jgi:aspartate aminotransferase
MFETLQPAAPDKILGLMDELRRDSRARKVDLGVGVYRNERGETPIFAAVREAERRLCQTEQSKTYIGLEGHAGFNAAMVRLVLGDAVDARRVRACQSCGGSGALRILGDLLCRARPDATIWLPNPTWPNHQPLMSAAEFRIATYPYYDVASGVLQFDAMLSALSQARAGDIVLLHGCCHNPSGADLTLKQWAQVATLIEQAGLFPLVDVAYQGFGEGLSSDTAGLRLLAGRVPELAVAVSCSKNFGVYRDRVGCAIMIAQDERQAETAVSQLAHIVRAEHSMAPAHGAATVHLVLEDVALREAWSDELNAMRQRIQAMREGLAQALRARTNSPHYDFLARQRGLFSLINVSPADLDELRIVHGIYMVDGGRMNVAGLREEQLEFVAEAIAAVCRQPDTRSGRS